LIRESGGSYKVVSESGRNLGSGYQSRGQAMKRLSQVEHFKRRSNRRSRRAKKRDYKDEYRKFQSSGKMKKYRAELNRYNHKKGTYGNRDGKDASHRGGKIVGFEDESINRGRH